MITTARRSLGLLGVSLFAWLSLQACNGDSSPSEAADASIASDATAPSDASNAILGQNALGTIPTALENELYLGVFENRGYDWMANSGVGWNARYMYLSHGWADNWGSTAYNGDIAYEFMVESQQLGALPVLEFYVLTFIEEYREDLYDKTTDADIMRAFFEEYMLLLTRIKEFGEPVVVLVEADGYAVLQIYSDSDPSRYSAVADTQIPELSGLPNTVAGWGLAFLELKRQMEVDNVFLGMHISAWATGQDLAYSSAEIELQPAVDETYEFLAPLGLAPNQTGLEFDFLVGDPLDRDADFYRIEHNDDRWWDASADASIYIQSFNRYAEWLRLWNIKAQKRWILWQIAMGNEHSLNVPNTGNPGEGYKDNRVEYFLGENSDAHIAKFADCGVIALLFGYGAEDQANYLNDQDDNGDLFLRDCADRFFSRGGATLKR